jgi:hypothetical protein
MTSPTPDAPFKLFQLPKELRNTIYSHLDNGDVKNLRAICSALKKDVPLRLSHIFLSANSLNIQVFRAVADHDDLCHNVTEIIWDDARLLTGPDLEEERTNYRYDGQQADAVVTDNGCPLWFKKGCVDTWYSDHRVEPPVKILGLQESWAYYKTLLQDQDQILASNADIETFKYGLERFPSLKRITITPATHGTDFKPLYKSSMIRALPSGFDYPRPNTWPAFSDAAPIDALPWDGQDGPFGPYQQMYGVNCNAEAYRGKWRGYRAATRALAEDEQHHVTELVVGGNEVGSGINCHIFDQPCVEYNDLVTLLQRPGFSHLSLDLFTGLLEHEDWVSYKSGLLHDALAEAKDLRHICIRTTTDIAEGGPGQLDPDDLEEMDLSLSTIFPIDQWPRLEHFGLSRFIVEMDDLMAVLAALPASLRSVELSHLAFTRMEDGYEDLLLNIRDTLDWRSRPAQERPKVHIVASANPLDQQDEFVEVDEAAYSFLYEDGENPFEGNGSIIYEGRGGILRDVFNSELAAPY